MNGAVISFLSEMISTLLKIQLPIPTPTHLHKTSGEKFREVAMGQKTQAQVLSEIPSFQLTRYLDISDVGDPESFSS